MMSNMFTFIDYSNEWNILYCNRWILNNKNDKQTMIRLKKYQFQYWFKNFIEHIDISLYPREYNNDNNDLLTKQLNHLELLNSWLNADNDPLKCINDLIEMIKMWNTYSEYYKVDKNIDFCLDLYDFLLLRKPLKYFLWTRLYNDEWDDDITYECYHDLVKENKLHLNMNFNNILYVVYDWFRIKKRRFPSHDHIYWITYDIDYMLV